MKKLYQRKGTVHPSSDQLSFLPATILILTVALSPSDKEILAYLISCSSSSSSFNGNSRRKTKEIVDGDHPPLFHCSCFNCYMSYWIRWNSSPNHQLLHKIIDDFEDFLSQKRKKKNKKGSNNRKSSESNRSELESVAESSSSSSSNIIDSVKVENEEKVGSSLRKFVSFIGERIWGR